MTSSAENNSNPHRGESTFDYASLLQAAKVESKQLEQKSPKYSFETVTDLAAVPSREVVSGDQDFDTALNIKFITNEYSESQSGNYDTPVKMSDLNQDERDNVGQRIENYKNRLAESSWWLAPEWQDKLSAGELQEQLTFSARGAEISIYNFGEALTDAEVEELRGAMDIIAQIKAAKKYAVASAILISPDVEHKDVVIDGESKLRPILGQANYKTKTIEVKPAGRSIDPKVGEAFSTISHTITHEFGHLIEDDNSLRLAWADAAGWERDYDVSPPGWKLKEGEVPPTKYAATTPAEDFAESVTYLIMEPDELDPKRRDFLIKNLLGTGDEAAQPIDDKPDVQVSRRLGSDIVLPTSQAEIPYRVTNTISYFSLGG